MDAGLEDDLHDVLDDWEETSDFPLNLSEFQAVDTSNQPQIIIDKARGDIVTWPQEPRVVGGR